MEVGKYVDPVFNQFLFSFKSDPSTDYDTAVSNMRKYFLNLVATNYQFIFEELNRTKWVVEFLPGQKVTVFEYFDVVSDLFFVSYMDVYNMGCNGFSTVKLFHNQYKQQQQSPDKPSHYDEHLQSLVDMGFP